MPKTDEIDSGNAPLRKRNAGATKAAILEAARQVFCDRGYDSAGTREIAERANVNVALINRYFGSKEKLFASAIPPTLSIDGLLEGPMESFGERVAAAFSGKTADKQYDPMIALLRAASSRDAVPALRTALNRQVVEPIALKLLGDDKLERASLISAQLAGFDLVGRVLGLKTTTIKAEKSALQQQFAKVLQSLVDG